MLKIIEHAQWPDNTYKLKIRFRLSAKGMQQKQIPFLNSLKKIKNSKSTPVPIELMFLFSVFHQLCHAAQIGYLGTQGKTVNQKSGMRQQ